LLKKYRRFTKIQLLKVFSNKTMWPFKKQETQEEREVIILNEEIRKSKLKGKKLKFDPVKHEYSLGDTILTGVTDCIKSFFEPFDRIYWAEYVANRDGKTTEGVLDEWQEKRMQGDKVHKLIQDYINGKQNEDYPNEVLKAIYFLQSLQDVKEITSEKIVYSIEWEIAGTIDVVIETSKGVILLDWKTTKNLRMDNSYRRAKSPISHLDDCNYNLYALQLNLYKSIFEQQFGKKVIEIGFVKLAEGEPLEYFSVKDLSHEIYLMMNHWKQYNKIV